ncbi:MAG: FGGY-family carbohydrate kinase, partial [Anaerolineaceae bacterium]|nr:FGGY-family carbohydrate kinase [Anaerolineaceae bacterium]
MWLKEHEPQIWKNADKFLLYEDFIINKLTGIPVISKCLASRTQMYDLEKEQWSEKMLNFLELDKSRLAEDRPSGDPVGKMKPDLAEELGFKTLPLIAVGGHDQACGALGAGLTKPGLAMVSTGTAEVVEVSMDSTHLNDTLFRGNMSVYLHTFPGLYVVMTLNQSGGFMLRWFRDTFCQFEQETAESQGGDAYDFVMKGAGPEPSPILMLPHLAGSGTPLFDTLSKGAVVGITFATTKTDFAKAILDALTMELRLNLEVLKDGGITIDEIRAIGGGAKSELWLQLKADVIGISVAAPEVTEAAGMGAAILAGVAAGVFPDTAAAIDSHLKIKKIYTPNPDIKALYDERYHLYKKLYPAVKEINHIL